MRTTAKALPHMLLLNDSAILGNNQKRYTIIINEKSHIQSKYFILNML